MKPKAPPPPPGREETATEAPPSPAAANVAPLELAEEEPVKQKSKRKSGGARYASFVDEEMAVADENKR